MRAQAQSLHKSKSKMTAAHDPDHFSHRTDRISPFVALWPRIGTTAALALRIRVTDRTCARVDTTTVVQELG